MRETTLCYIERDGAYLLLHRVKKKNDVNHDKWIGVGGGIEAGETPELCVRREVTEETGLVLTDVCYRAVIGFSCPPFEEETMYLFTSDAFSGEIRECDEGVLEWVPKAQASLLPTWEGDKIFLSLLAKNKPFFHLNLSYDGDRLIHAVLDGKDLSLPFPP